MSDSAAFVRRSFWAGTGMAAVGAVLTAIIWGPKHGISFLLGYLLSVVNLRLLVRSVNAALDRGKKIGGIRIAAAYILRLLLIPLCLYAMMHFLFFKVIAAIAGFAVFSGGFLIEGIIETAKGPDK